MIYASALMFINVTLLIILVPGGPIENRDFNGLRGIVFWGFNVFLIILGIISYITSYLLLISNPYALLMAQIISVLYFIVYIIDLAQIFPKSPTKMSKTLMLIEEINASLAIFLFIFVTAIGRSV
jgi:hypothetical protein